MADENRNNGRCVQLPRRMRAGTDDEEYQSDIDDVHQDGWDDQPITQRCFVLQSNLGRQPYGSFQDEACRMISELSRENQDLIQEVRHLTATVEVMGKRLDAIPGTDIED